MAAVTAVARFLRLDGATWSRLATMDGIGSGALVVIGAFAIFALDRFGVQGFIEPRGAVRMLLTGFYGWVWLAGSVWLIARLVSRSEAPFVPVFRLVGRAHLPLLVVAITVQALSVVIPTSGPAFALSLFAVAFWMPALLVAATRTAIAMDMWPATLAVTGPYLIWLLVVGRFLQTQVGHLL